MPSSPTTEYECQLEVITVRNPKLILYDPLSSPFYSGRSHCRHPGTVAYIPVDGYNSGYPRSPLFLHGTGVARHLTRDLFRPSPPYESQPSFPTALGPGPACIAGANCTHFDGHSWIRRRACGGDTRDIVGYSGHHERVPHLRSYYLRFAFSLRFGRFGLGKGGSAPCG